MFERVSGLKGGHGVGLGGQGEVKALLDDGVFPVSGEEDYQREEDQWIQYKLSRNFSYCIL